MSGPGSACQGDALTTASFEAHRSPLTILVRHPSPAMMMYLSDTKTDLERAIEGSEQRLAVRITDAKAEIIKWVFGAVGLQTLAILGGVAALIHLLK